MELIDKRKLVEAIRLIGRCWSCSPCTTDAVPGVRCSECKHFRRWDDGQTTCDYWTDQWDMPAKSDGFCSYGEREEG